MTAAILARQGHGSTRIFLHSACLSSRTAAAMIGSIMGRTQMVNRLATALATLGLTISLTLAAQAQSAGELYDKAKAEGAFAFYVGGPTAPWEARTKAFEEKYPGIKVSVGGGFSNVLDQKIDQQNAHKTQGGCRHAGGCSRSCTGSRRPLVHSSRLSTDGLHHSDADRHVLGHDETMACLHVRHPRHSGRIYTKIPPVGFS